MKGTLKEMKGTERNEGKMKGNKIEAKPIKTSEHEEHQTSTI